MRLCSFFFLTCMLVSLVGPLFAEDPKPNLETAYREWEKGFTSKDKEEQLKTLRKMLPTKEDIEYLFPKHSDKIWAKQEKFNKEAEEHLEDVVKEISRGGEIKKMEAVDVRKDKGLATGEYKRVFEMIPACFASVESGKPLRLG